MALLANEAETMQLVDECHNQKLNWIYFAGDEGKIAVKGKGTGGYSEISSFFVDTEICYVLFGIQAEDEGDYTQTKWLLISWVGPQTGSSDKARSSQHRNELFDLINARHRLAGEFQALHSSEISEKLLADRILMSKVGQKSEETLLAAAAADREKKAKREGTGLNKGAQKVEGDSPFAESQTEECKTHILDVQNIGSTTTWALFGYQGGKDDHPVYMAKGTGGASEFVSYLKDDSACFVVHAIASDEGDYSLRKIMVVNFVGPNVKPTTRVRSSVHRAQIYAYAESIGPMHGEYQAFGVDEVTDELFLKKLAGTKILDESRLATSSARKRVFGEGSSRRDMVLADEKGLLDDILSLTKGSGVDFIVLSYNNQDELEVTQKGAGSIATFKPSLKDDEVYYIFMGTAVAEGNYSVQKQVLITWVGTEVVPLFRSMSAQHRVLLYNLGNTVIQMHGESQALHPDDLSDALLQQKLAGSKYVDAAGASELSAAHKARAGTGKVEKFEFTDEEATKAAIEQVRAEKLNWLFFEHNDAGTLDLLHKGTGGYDEIAAHWDDTHVSYVLLGITFEDEGDYTQIKLVLITWVGTKVEPMEKARSSQTRVMLYDYIKTMVQLAGEFQALEPSEISEKQIVDKIAQTTVGQKSEEELLRAAAEDAKKKEKREGTGLDKTEQKKVAPNPFVNADEGKEAILDFGSPKSETNWAAFGYNNKSNDLYFLKKGNGQLSEFQDDLKNDNLVYILYGVVDITDGDYSTLKYMLIAWVGVDVKPLHRARSGHHRMAIYQYASDLIPMHGELQVMTPADLSEEELRKKLIGSKILEEGDEERALAAMSRTRTSTASHDNAIVWQDAEGVKKAVLSLRSDTEMVDYVVFGYSDDGKYTIILEKGKGGVASCRKHFKDDAVIFVVMSAVVPDGAYSVQKNILIAWVGPDVPPLARSRSSQNRVQLYQYATELIQLHGEIQALSAAEISDDLVTQKLSGSKYDTAGGEEEGAAAHRIRARKGQTFSFTIDDPKGFDDLLKEFRARKLNWIILGYEGDDETVRVKDKGTGGYSEVTKFLKDDNLIYFLLGVSPEDEGNYTQIKNILVTWVGPSVEPLQKGLSSQHRVALYQTIKRTVQLHGELQALNSSELSEQLIFEKLTLSKERKEGDLVACRLKDEAKAAEKEKKERSQTSASKYMFVSTSEVASPFQGAEEEKAKAAIEDVADENTETNYIVFGYAANKSDQVVVEKGTGDVSSFSKYFEADKITYVLYGITFLDGDYSVIKRVLITWVGQKVKPLHKARSSQHRAALYKYVNSIAVLTGEYHALSGQVEEVSDDLIRKKLEGTKILDEGAKVGKKTSLPSARGNRGFKRGESFQFKWEDEALVDKAIQSITKGEIEWVQFGNTEQSNFITVLGSGKGDIEAIKGQLTDGDISYFVLAKDCPDQSVSGREAGNYNVVRNVFINWVGPEVKPMVKARSSQHRVAVYSNLKMKIQLHGEIQLSARDELTLDVVYDKLGVTGWRVS